MPQISQKIVKLYPDGKGRCVRVILKKSPVPSETCSITTEPIGCIDVEVPYAPSDKPFVFDALPHLTCGEMPCGHRFHATALFVHLMRNGMRCPLCRAGTDRLPRKDRLPLVEKWFAHTVEAVERERARELTEQQAEDREIARQMAHDQLQSLRIINILPETRVVIWATIWVSDPTSSVQMPGMHMNLTLCPSQTDNSIFVYRMTNAQLREISREASTMQNPTIAATMHATRFTESQMPQALHIQLEHTEGITSTNMTPTLDPPGSVITVEISNEREQFVLRSFVYRPCRMTVIAMFMDMDFLLNGIQ